MGLRRRRHSDEIEYPIEYLKPPPIPMWVQEMMLERAKENLPVTDTIESKRATIARLEQEITELENQPKDNRPDGAIIKFDKEFSSSPGRLYKFAAIKMNGIWYISGARSTTPRTRTWEQLLDYIGPKNWYTIRDMMEAPGRTVHYYTR